MHNEYRPADGWVWNGVRQVYHGHDVIKAQAEMDRKRAVQRAYADMPLALIGDHPDIGSPWVTVVVAGVAIDAEATFYRLMAGRV